MLSSFTVKNYRGFRDLTVEPLGPVNIISGMNNTGKTSFLESLHLHINPLNLKLFFDLDLLRGSPLDHSTLREVSRWSFHNAKLNPPIVLTSRDDQGVSRTAEISIRRLNKKGSVATTSPAHKKEAFLPPSGRSAVLMNYEDSNGFKAKNYNYLTFDGAKYLLKREFGDLRSRFLESWPRSPKDDVEDFSRVKSGKRLDSLLGPLSLLEPRLIGLSLLVFGGRPEIHADINLPRLVPLSFMGEGVKRLLSILLAIANCPSGGAILIDEIENGLHYSVMPKVWRAIAEAARRSKRQVFATTHSYECIRSAHEAFSENEPYDLRVHRLERVEDQLQAVTYNQKSLETSLELNWEIR